MGTNSMIKPYPSHVNSWLSCSAFCVAVENTSPHGVEPYNTDQLEGLALHKVAEAVLTGVTTVDNVLNTTIKVKNTPVVITQGMMTRVNKYIDYIRSINHRGVLNGVETPVTITSISPNYRGKIDYWQYSPINKTLTVVDYKDGWGRVSPVQNYTLSSYMIGLLDNVGMPHGDILKYESVIYQPRVSDEPLIFSFDRDVVKLHIQRIKIAYDKAVNGPHIETPGYHCKYCKARTRCAGFNHTVDNLYTAYQYYNDPSRNYNIGRRLEFLEHAAMMINASLDAEREKALYDITQGNPVEGYRVTEGQGRLVFNNTVIMEDVKNHCEMYGITATTEKLRTPKQLKDAGIPSEWLRGKTVKTQGNRRLVKISEQEVLELFKEVK